MRARSFGSEAKTAQLALGCLSLSSIVIIAMAAAIVSINNRELFNVTTWCDGWSFWWPNCRTVANLCWISRDPTGNMNPCQYLYSLGSLGFFFQFFISLAMCVAGPFAGGCLTMNAFLAFGWWLAGGIYFTIEVQNMPANTPAGNYRDAIIGLTWTAFAMSVVQLTSVVVVARAASNMAKAALQMPVVEPMSAPQPVYTTTYPTASPAPGYPVIPMAAYAPQPQPPPGATLAYAVPGQPGVYAIPVSQVPPPPQQHA